MMAGEVCTVDFYIELAHALRLVHFPFHPPSRTERSNITRSATGSTTPSSFKWSPPKDPIYGQFHFPCRVEVNSEDRRRSRRAVIEFTGERVIPGEVNDDLWAEHIARYAFAPRLCLGPARARYRMRHRIRSGGTVARRSRIGSGHRCRARSRRLRARRITRSRTHFRPSLRDRACRSPINPSIWSPLSK